MCVQRSMLPCVLCLLVPNFGRCARPSYPARTHPIAVARAGDEGDTAPHISVHLTYVHVYIVLNA